MAAKKKTVAKKIRVSKLASVTQQLTELQTAIRQYFTDLSYQQPSSFEISLPAKTDDKDTMIRISSLMSSVMTGAGLGKEVRLIAEPAPTGGRLVVRFFSPVPKNGLDLI